MLKLWISILLLLSPSVFAQSPTLLKDINIEPRSITPEFEDSSHFYPIGNKLLIPARDQVLGSQLWISNGQKLSSLKLMNSLSRQTFYNFSPISLGNLTYFIGYQGDSSALYSTDGTEQGTQIIGGSSVYNLIALGDKLFFEAYSEQTGYEPWISDGTAAGTKLLKDIVPGKNSSGVFLNKAVSGNLAFFQTHNAQGKLALWKTDGTTNGTVEVKEIPDPDGYFDYYYSEAAQVSGLKYYFTKVIGDDQMALWVSDGTAAGTIMLMDSSSTGSVGFSQLSPGPVPGTLIFSNWDDTNGREPWISDGTAAGTVILKDLEPDSEGSFPEQFTKLGNKVFFVAEDTAHGAEIWVSDGTQIGTVILKDIVAGPNTSYPYALQAVGNKLYFSAYTSNTGDELWSSDGTEANTLLLKDINPGSSESYPFGFTQVGSDVWFIAYISGADQLFKTDGTPAGTVALHGLVLEGTSSSNITAVSSLAPKSQVLFPAYDPDNGLELWSSDGQAGGTVPISTWAPGYNDALEDYYSGESFVNLGNSSNMFWGYKSGAGLEPYVSDGTVGGTKLLLEISPGSSSSVDSAPVFVGGKAFFFANSPQYGRELWTSDGTIQNTNLLKDITPGTGGSDLFRLWKSTNLLWFARETDDALELWKSDGTPAGTALVKSFPDYVFFYSTSAYIGDVLFFTVNDDDHGTEIWKSDGTAAGTQILKDLVPGFVSSYPSALTNYNGRVYFSASPSSGSRKLWSTDGNEVTAILSPVYPESLGETFAATKDYLVFTFCNATNGCEPWRSDGTTNGTMLIRDTNPGPESGLDDYVFAPLASTDSSIFYFSAFNTASGSEPWVSDGTSEGTKMLFDLNAGAAGSFPSFLAQNGKQVYFTASDFAHGQELWSFTEDSCFKDPNKLTPGICGCGVADTDSDADGKADCQDACPLSAAKIVAGQCGCGAADTDSDADGTADCLDVCPVDPSKTAAGQCGCGIQDLDSNANGTLDCLEPKISSSFVPNKPSLKLVKKKKKVVVSMQPFNGVKYTIIFTKKGQKKPLKFTSNSNAFTSRNLAPGVWTVSYQIAQDSIVTKSSTTAKIKVK